MKPKTKLQKEVANLSDYSLSNLDRSFDAWAIENCFERIAFATKKQICCLECGYRNTREDRKKRWICPNCHKRLKVVETQKRTMFLETYVGVLDTLDRFQVNRFFLLRGRYKVGQAKDIQIEEVCQQWIDTKGKSVIYAQRHKVNYIQDFWTGEFEIRSNSSQYYWKHNLYNIIPSHYYPKMSIQPWLKRLGVKKAINSISLLDLMTKIQEDNRVESLLKMGQKELLRHYLYDSYRCFVDRYWKSICICQRNKYKVKDATLWFDYIDSLVTLDKDILNPHYICPNNLREAHDVYLNKKRKFLKKKREREERELIQSYEKKYMEDKLAFIGLNITKGDLVVSVLNSVQEFQDESDTLKHCVFTNHYFMKKDSLILSAKIRGISVATIEVSLQDWKILQCRGYRNSVPERNEEIISLVNKWLPTIQKKAV